MLNEFEQFIRWEVITHDSIDVKRIYIDMVNDLEAGVMLSQILYYYLPTRNDQGKITHESKLRIKKHGHLWLAKQRSDWWNECRLTERQSDRALEILINKGLVYKHCFRFNGLKTTHIRIIKDNFIKALNEQIKLQTLNDNDQPNTIEEVEYQEETEEKKDTVKPGSPGAGNRDHQKCDSGITKNATPLTKNTTKNKKHILLTIKDYNPTNQYLQQISLGIKGNKRLPTNVRLKRRWLAILSELDPNSEYWQFCLDQCKYVKSFEVWLDKAEDKELFNYWLKKSNSSPPKVPKIKVEKDDLIVKPIDTVKNQKNSKKFNCSDYYKKLDDRYDMGDNSLWWVFDNEGNFEDYTDLWYDYNENRELGEPYAPVFD